MKTDNDRTNKTMRLNRRISDSGFCSRRQADRYIEQGRVKVNGKPAELGQQVTAIDRIEVDGRLIERRDPEDYVYLALNKPVGITCTTDRRRRDNIIDYLGYPERVYPIGRLDRDSEGLILLTNDGSIVNRILRESNHKEKEYKVRVDKPYDNAFLEGMANGVPILGTVTKPCRIERTGADTFRIILTQGLNRQIRRMCEYFGYHVTELQRVRIMHITLGNMQPGEYRELTYKELRDLKALLNRN